MHDAFTELELIARHRIAERVRHAPRAPRPAPPSAADPQAPLTPDASRPRTEGGSATSGKPDRGQDRIATPRRQ